jgi:hypothetical protein
VVIFVTTTVNLHGNVGALANIEPIPTLSEWAIGGLSGLLAPWAMVRLRRRSRAHAASVLGAESGTPRR